MPIKIGPKAHSVGTSRGVLLTTPPRSNVEVKGRLQLYLHSLSGLSLCHPLDRATPIPPPPTSYATG